MKFRWDSAQKCIRSFIYEWVNVKKMLTTVFRAKCMAQTIKPLLSSHGLRWDVWDRGEISQSGRPFSHHGACATVSEQEDSEAHWSEVERFLERHITLFSDLVTAGATLCIDTGFSVYAMRPGGFKVPPRILALLGRMSISLEASGYPCSEE